ncbi:MAG: phosphotransacetylase family protein [Haloferacaceae archaeon]
METILVSSVADVTGKTAVTLALATLADETRSVGYMKPKGTRLESQVGKTLDTDPMLARELLDLDAEMHDLEPVVYSPTFVQGAIQGREDPAELHDRIREAFGSLSADAELMFVEGGGRYTTGGVVDLSDVDVAELLDARVVLVADYEEPGDLDELLGAADAFGDRLDGIVFNAVDDSAYDGLERDAIPFLEAEGIDVFGAIPEERELSGVTVDGLAEELGADVLTDVPTDAFVERFLVGAMSGDAALRHFRRARDAAVITGGDRADVQTAALEAPGIRCLVLTGGHRPSSAVLGKASEVGMPVLAVNTDTLTAIERAENVVRSGRTRSPETISVMRNLLTEHADVDRLLR